MIEAPLGDPAIHFSIPEKWAERDRVFQTLAPVYRHNLNQIFVALEAQLELVTFVHGVALRREPTDQRLDSWNPLALCMCEFREVEEIGETAFAIHEFRQSFDDMLLDQQAAQHPDEAA